MRLFLVITGDGDENYILASCPEDAKRYFKDVHIIGCRELKVMMSIDVAKHLYQK